jgi:hypothetical protein
VEAVVLEPHLRLPVVMDQVRERLLAVELIIYQAPEQLGRERTADVIMEHRLTFQVEAAALG